MVVTSRTHVGGQAAYPGQAALPIPLVCRGTQQTAYVKKKKGEECFQDVKQGTPYSYIKLKMGGLVEHSHKSTCGRSRGAPATEKTWARNRP